jgi:hypothetical protein
VSRRAGFFYALGDGRKSRAERYGYARKKGTMKLAWFFRLFGEGGKPAWPSVAYDPVYGLPKSEIDAWLARNPELRRQHEAALQQLRSGEEPARRELCFPAGKPSPFKELLS